MNKKVPFRWQNVPRMFVLFAVVISAVAVVGAFSPGMFGRQNLTFPVICAVAAAWWGIVYYYGRRPYPDEPPAAAEQETPAERASREFAEEQPTFQDYLDAEEYIEERRQQTHARLDPSHHYDERI
ncbi:MAG: hypothetical protein HDQ87_07065 [Clostridia bacterium]|nr:hypothetical protein [Clostridia bacterium]